MADQAMICPACAGHGTSDWMHLALARCEQCAGTGRPRLTETRVIPCPRCHEVCGWCSDYRWHHGIMRLPGHGGRCGIKAMAPEGSACPMCHGTRSVRAATTYEPAPPETSNAR